MLYVLIGAFALFFYQLADIEDLTAPSLWGVGSAALTIGCVFLWGFFGLLGGQVLLLVAMIGWVYICRHRGPYAIGTPVAMLRHVFRRCPNCGLDLKKASYDRDCPSCGYRIPE